ncbi:MAG TPA: hypothetical protein VK088_11070, partial [Acidimicrobiia bacterium]|nr:hypothetical protein [Acidimicrobiia bacterium]
MSRAISAISTMSEKCGVPPKAASSEIGIIRPIPIGRESETQWFAASRTSPDRMSLIVAHSPMCRLQTAAAFTFARTVNASQDSFEVYAAKTPRRQR